MILKKTATVLLFFLINFAFSQEQKTATFFETNYTFHSEITGKEQQLQVSLPENYHQDTTKKYPVLYIIDGQNWFAVATSLQKVFTGTETNFKSMPDFIVVGITTNWKERREFFSSKKTKNTINFIENEVVHFIDTNFRTSTERILFGWQFAGGFVINALAEKPALFSGYLAATPVFFNPNVMDTLLTEHKNLHSFLYVSGTKEEAVTWVKTTIEILTKKAPESFNWTYNEISAHGAFGHRISPVETISYGLRAYFYDYPLLEFKNVDEFNKKGGLAYVKTFYKERAKKYNISEDMGQWGRYLLVRLAIRENNYPTLDVLINEFKGSGFIENLRTGQANTCAELYLKNNEPDEAIKIFNIIIKNNPKNARAYNGLGKAYQDKGDRTQAIESYKKAITHAENTNDENLNTYKADLDKIKN